MPRPPPRRRASRSPSRQVPIPVRQSRHFIRLDFAYATRSVLYAMAIVMAAGAVAAIVGLRRGVQEEVETSAAEAA